jgi:nicotinamidase-related amidase
MLNDFLDEWDRPRLDRLIHAINELVQIMRKASRPVIWVRQELESASERRFLRDEGQRHPWGVKSTTVSQIDWRLAICPSDVVIVKKRYRAFLGADLDQVLDGLQPDRLVHAGITIHACIRLTVIDADQKDWSIILPSDCVDS